MAGKDGNDSDQERIHHSRKMEEDFKQWKMVKILGGCLWSYFTRPEDSRVYSAPHCPEYGVKVRSALHSQGSGAGRSQTGEAYDRWNIPWGGKITSVDAPFANRERRGELHPLHQVIL